MLLFDVSGQTLKRTDHFNPATDSVEYLKAKFTFNDTAWSGKVKTALFRLGNAVYKSVIDTSGVCKVPAEVLVGGVSRLARLNGETIYVSLLGEYSTTRITTNEVGVKLNRSGYGDAETPADPTESEYAQMTAVAADAVAEAEAARTECETARADLVGVKNLFANAIKGNLSGAVVFADDVSPVEHNPVVRVHGKNLFDVSKLSNITGKLTKNNDGTLTVAANQYAVPTGKKINELCPSLKAGAVCTLSFSSTSANTKYIWLNGANVMLYNSTYTFTDEMLNSELYLYGFRDTDVGYGSACTISNIQIEEGTTSTEYTPYIDPSSVTVTRYGKNLQKNDATTQTINGVTFTVNDDGSVTVNGTATKDARFLIYKRVPLRAGAKCTLNGNPNGGSASTYYLQTVMAWGGADHAFYDYGNGCEIEVKGTITASTVSINIKSGVTVNGLVFKPMIRLASIADGSYEEYTATTHNPAADGTVSDITSLSPNMTILTDTEGVIVECEYNRDTNKVIDKLINAITALGGTV